MDVAVIRTCAAIVLHEPDIALLERLADGLRETTVFAFANGPISDAALLALSHTDLHLTRCDDNVGLGRGLNEVMAAAASAGFTHVMLLDQDSEPPSGMLEALGQIAGRLERQGERIAAIAPRLVPPSKGNYKPIAYSWRSRSNRQGLAAIDFAPTSGSLVSVAAYRDVGTFRDDFFIGGIDVEWGFRSWDRGWTTLLATDLLMVHRWGETAERGNNDLPQILRHAPVRNYYYARNVIATARLPHVPIRWRAKSCLTLAGQIATLAMWGKSGSLRFISEAVKDGLKNRLGPAPSRLF